MLGKTNFYTAYRSFMPEELAAEVDDVSLHARPASKYSSYGCKWTLRNAIAFLRYWWFQYELATCLYGLEPWERILFHVTFAVIFSVTIYTAYIFLPT